VGKFGDVESVRTHWDKGYLFVVYKEPESALQMFQQLQHYEGRKQYVKILKTELQEIQKPTFVSPKADFYVRWPQNTSKRTRMETELLQTTDTSNSNQEVVSDATLT
jgi:hypothetical protein